MSPAAGSSCPRTATPALPRPVVRAVPGLLHRARRALPGLRGHRRQREADSGLQRRAGRAAGRRARGGLAGAGRADARVRGGAGQLHRRLVRRRRPVPRLEPAAELGHAADRPAPTCPRGCWIRRRISRSASRAMWMTGPRRPSRSSCRTRSACRCCRRVADGVESPLVAVLMSWERGGPWVYPDCFPPVGGDKSLTDFLPLARERGWHVGSFCNGTRWVMKPPFERLRRRRVLPTSTTASRGCAVRHERRALARGAGTEAGGRATSCCMAQSQTRQIAAATSCARLIGWGMESIQFFDQNCNAATFPCFASDHGHPPVPGKWMARGDGGR